MKLNRSILVRAALLISVMASLTVPSSKMQAAGGDLDPLFGTGGKVVTNFSASSSGYAVVLQPDGKIVVGGGINDANGFLLVRYMPNGSLDPTFGSAGSTLLRIGAFGGIATIALQSDGKIVVAGVVTSPITGNDFILMRCHPNGSLDSSFGAFGVVTTDFSGNSEDVSKIVIQPDGRIVAAGRSYAMSFPSFFALTRYNSDGSLDPSFGISGKVFYNFNGLTFGCKDLALQADGKLLVAGSADSFFNDFAVVRHNADGSFDTSFGSGGLVTIDFFNSSEIASALAVQANGKILVGGSVANPGTSTNFNFGLVRFETNGSLDTSFGIGGKVTTEFFGQYDLLSDMEVEADGKIVAAGVTIFSNLTLDSDCAIARYNRDGSLDSTFGAGGKVTTDFFGYRDEIRALAIQPDGRIVVTGATQMSADVFDQAIAMGRYLGGVRYDTCLQDDSSGNRLQINTTSGEYQFTTCSGFTVGGTGILTSRGSTLTLQHNSTDRRVMVTIDTTSNRATATLQMLSQGVTFRLTDRNILNNTCTCR